MECMPQMMPIMWMIFPFGVTCCIMLIFPVMDFSVVCCLDEELEELIFGNYFMGW